MLYYIEGNLHLFYSVLFHLLFVASGVLQINGILLLHPHKMSGLEVVMFSKLYLD